MSDVIVSSTSAVDATAQALIPYFGTALDSTDPFWRCEEIEDGPGAPGRARIIVPLQQGVVDQQGNSMALSPDAPLFEHGEPCVIYRRRYSADGSMRDALVMAGTVVEVNHILDDGMLRDALEIIVEDGVRELQEVRVFGRWVYQPSELLTAFQQGWPCHFNPGGRPNCLFNTAGHPMFSPHPDYGLTADETPPDASEKSTFKACYWTLSTILLYLWIWYGPTCPTNYTDTYNEVTLLFPELKRVPTWIAWTDSFGSSLDDLSVANFDSGEGSYTTSRAPRKGRDLNLSGRSLASVPGDAEPGVFDSIFQAAGGWTWYMAYDAPPGEMSNTLTSAPSRWLSAETAQDMPFASGGLAKNVMDVPVITRGRFGESSRNTCTRAVGHGSLVKIETRVATGGNGLLFSTINDEDEFAIDVCTQGGGAPSPESFAKAVAVRPYALCTFELDTAFDFQNGTEFGPVVDSPTQPNGYPRAKIRRPVWPTLLSFRGAVGAAGDMQPYPIRVEAYVGGAWVLAWEGHSWEVWDNGIIYIPGLRDAALNGHYGSWSWTDSEAWKTTTINGSPAIAITRNALRMTLAIPCDHRLSYVVRANSDHGTDVASIALMDDGPDAIKFHESFSRTKYVDLRQLYHAWLRISSYPEPAAAGGTMAANLVSTRDPATAVRSDLEMLTAHTKRMLLDRFGLEKSGPLIMDGHLVTTWKPGMAITNFVPVGDSTKIPWPAYCVLGRRRMVSAISSDGIINRTEFLTLG